ncbi:MAG: DeoR/GlpR family DNA-binding transcription regulator [Cellulosilyticaceae bacterium]
MLPIERQQALLGLLTQKKALRLTEIMSHFHISLETVRRDVQILEGQGKIEKFYGGIQLRTSLFGESSMDDRMVNRLPLKEAIAYGCSKLITDGDCIFIDSGSTTCHIAKYIKDRRNLTVITNSLLVINELLGTDIELIIIGGKFRRSEQSIIAYDYLFNFDQLHIAKAFIGCGAIDPTQGIFDFNMEEAHTRKLIIKHSHKLFVAIDHSKFEKQAPIHIAFYHQITGIFTDDQLSKTMYKNFPHATKLTRCMPLTF